MEWRVTRSHCVQQSGHEEAAKFNVQERVAVDPTKATSSKRAA